MISRRNLKWDNMSVLTTDLITTYLATHHGSRIILSAQGVGEGQSDSDIIHMQVIDEEVSIDTNRSQLITTPIPLQYGMPVEATGVEGAFRWFIDTIIKAAHTHSAEVEDSACRTSHA